MQSQYFLSSGNPIFGVYHPAENKEGFSSSHAVVLCPPFGQEANRSHKCFMSLAKRLAKNGIHVLRFAYRGTDDSSMWSDEISSLRDWTQDIVAAKMHLQQLSGCSTIMLVGLRLGANLALQVARVSADVHSVVLWEPIEDGREYLHNLRQNQKEMIDLWPCRITTQDNEETEELFSTRYQRSLLAEIEQVRLETHDLRQPTLVISAANHSATPQPADRLQKRPVITRDEMEKRLETEEIEGWRDLKQLEVLWWRPQSLALVASETQEMFARVESLGWYRQSAFAMTASRSESPSLLQAYASEGHARSGDDSVSDSLLEHPVTAASGDQEARYLEHAVRFGEAGQLVGVLTEPRRRIENSPVVIMLNAGIVHRVGPFRLHVNLARVLAQQGISSLRFDLSGLGDSPARQGKRTKDERVRQDVDDAIEFLGSHGLGDRFVLFGLCSGAYHAHQVAVFDPRVVGAIFVDGIVFRTLGFYVRHHLLRLLRPRFWRNAMKRRWQNALRVSGVGAYDEAKQIAEAEYFQVDRSRQAISQELRELEKRSTEMLFIYTGGYDDVCGRSQFREMFGIAPSDQIQVDYWAHSEHTFPIAGHREQLCRRIGDWMKGRFSRPSDCDKRTED